MKTKNIIFGRHNTRRITWQKITEDGKILLCNRAIPKTNECKEFWMRSS
jgi:hypothetical protein